MDLAIFDLDHTLLPFDCEWGWINYVAEKAGLNPREAFAPLKPLYVDYYEKHTLDADAFSRFQMQFMSRFARKDLDLWREEFVREKIAPHVSEKALSLVKSHKDRGDRTAVCSGTYAYLVEPIAKFFGIDAVLCAKPAMDSAGEFLGRLEGPNSFAANKVLFVREYLQECGVTFNKMYFYSDSLNDKPLFDFVDAAGGICVATNPDDALLALAQLRGWKTLWLYGKEENLRANAIREVLGI